MGGPCFFRGRPAECDLPELGRGHGEWEARRHRLVRLRKSHEIVVRSAALFPDLAAEEANHSFQHHGSPLAVGPLLDELVIARRLSRSAYTGQSLSLQRPSGSWDTYSAEPVHTGDQYRCRVKRGVCRVEREVCVPSRKRGGGWGIYIVRRISYGSCLFTGPSRCPHGV